MAATRNYDNALELHLDPHPVDSDIFGKRRIDDLSGAMEDRKVQWQEDETTGSSMSDLSAEATDEFGRRLLQHHRDEKRLRDANRQPFRKARPKPRIAEAILREERLRESPKHDRNGSSGSNDSTPPVTVPREWGRKARRQPDWMRQILREPERNDGATPPAKPASADDSEWGSLRHMNTTFGPENLDADDFTSASLLASTPAPNSSRPMRKIDELTRRELLNLDDLDQSPSSAAARPSSTRDLRDSEMSSPSKIPRPLTAPATQSPSQTRLPRRQGSPTKDKQNGQPNGDSKSPSPNKPRPRHNRDDSMNLLRKLARVSSMSPSPARKPEPNLQNENKTEAAKSQSPPKARRSSGWGVEFDALTKSEPQPSPEPKESTESNDVEQPQPPAKSALEDIMRQNSQYGESTIQSLEDIAHPNVDPTVTLDLDEPAETAADVAAAATKEEPAVDDGLTQERKDQRQQELAMEGLNKHLQAAVTSIKDASRGLRRVENRIEAAQEGQQAPVPTTAAAKTVVIRKKPDADGFTHCDVCGGGYHSVWYAAWVEFRSLFYTYNPAARFGIAFTKLGLLCLTWLIWYFIECSLCEFYCTPKYAVPYSGFPEPGPATPRFPFTIPMLLLRPWREYWVDWFDALTVGVEAWFHDLTYQVPFESAVNPATTVKFSAGSKVFTENVASATAVRVAQSLMDAVDEVGSMWDDDLAW